MNDSWRTRRYTSDIWDGEVEADADADIGMTRLEVI